MAFQTAEVLIGGIPEQMWGTGLCRGGRRESCLNAGNLRISGFKLSETVGFKIPKEILFLV